MINRLFSSVTIAKFILITLLLLASTCYAYWHFQGVQCEPCLPKNYCPPCPSENKQYVIPAFLSLECLALMLFLAKRKDRFKFRLSRLYKE
jgi:hypothetical protein